ncbi:hypothetical protein CKO51_07090 [Rhodopirellula sp. SM50]|nr:suppressor of fused domain protein [Rhodopirellula sp. SM50]PAY20193.1 hypothetical protein CKO51_07090 [Rhodopirellula sp. SM50]
MPDQVIPDQWYIKTKNGKRGPYSVQQLQRYVDAGAILPNSGLGTGQGPWVAAATVRGLNFSAESIAKVRATKSSVSTGNATDAALNQRATDLQSREQVVQDRADELDARGSELDARANELEQREQGLEQREQGLEQREQELEQREQELEQREQELEQREQELEQREQGLEQREQGLGQREQELEQREQGLPEREQELEERTRKLDQRESELGQQQQEIQCRSQDLQQGESDLAARIAETQQLESRLQAEQAALQQRSEEMNQREAALADREQATRQLEQSLEEQQLAGADQDAPAALPPTASDDARDVSAESMLEEKKRLLQEFADRQASLSRREAELMRRENELTRRELDSVVTHDAATEPGGEFEVEPEPAPESAETVTTVQESEPQRPEEPVATESDSTSRAASSWQDVLGRAEEQPADFELAEYDGGSGEGVATVGEVAVATKSEDDRSDVAASQTGLSELRRLAYEERFGPCSRYDVDDDPSMRVDVSVHLPEDARDFTTLVTSGMSDYPIPMPNGQRSVRAELLLYVTHLDELAIQILRGAAKLPFRKKKGLSIGTTESLDELRDQLSGSEQQDCVYMLPVVESDSKPIPAKETIGGVVQLFWLVTITEAERKLIDTGGIHKFLSLLEKNHHAVFFDLTRDCYVKRKGWFRR